MTTIIGAGLGGLTLAKALQKQGKPVIIYEAEPNRKARVQAGVLGLDETLGQAALAVCGLTEQFKQRIVTTGGAFRILDKTGKVLFEESERPATARPEIDRWHLRNMLLDALKPQTVRWGCKLEKIVAEDGGRHKLAFANGSHATCGPIVGADGAWSSVRAFLSKTRPRYTGVAFLEFFVYDIAEHSEAMRLGKGSTFVLQDNKGIVAQRLGDDSLQVYAIMRGSEMSFKGANPLTITRAFTDWDPLLRKLLEHSKNGIRVRPIYALAPDFTWEHRPGVTLLGDAAHLVSPLSGDGVNLAMADAVDLAAATDWQAYEQAMCARGAASVQASINQLDAFVAPDGGAVLAAAMKHA